MRTDAVPEIFEAIQRNDWVAVMEIAESALEQEDRIDRSLMHLANENREQWLDQSYKKFG